VVLAAAADDGVLVERAQPRRGLARVVDAGPRSAHGVDVAAGGGGDAGGALQEIERRPLAGEERDHRRADFRDDVTRLDGITIVHPGHELARGLDGLERRLGERQAGQNAAALDQEARPAAIGRIEDSLAGDVRQVFVEGVTDDELNLARVHAGGMLSRPMPFRVTLFVDNLGAFRLRRGHVGALVACRADALVKKLTTE